MIDVLLQPRDLIQWYKMPGDKRLKLKVKNKVGTVTQVTDKLLAIQGPRYSETILISDLYTGIVVIEHALRDGLEFTAFVERQEVMID